MKKCRSALAFIALVVAGAFFANGAMVDEEVARTAATGFLSKSTVAKTILAGREVASIEALGNLWLVRLAPSGYIEIAGSTKCAPILSFSENDFAEPEVGSPFAAKLSSDTLMVEAKEAEEDAADNADWEKYTAPVAKKRTLAAAKPTGTDGTGYTPFVAPLLGATWNQTAPFNDLSPYNYFCGCMATAAGQELRYWRWPYRYEKFRQTTHGVRDAQFNYSDFVLRPNGLVPFNWDKVVASAPNPASTPWAADKEATYNTAWLSLWAQSLTGMGYKPGGSGGTRQLASSAEEYWYEKGKGYTYWNDGYDALWAAVKADLDWGSPIQINTAAHQMVIDGYAVENYGEADEVDWINLNLGYGNATYWDNLRTAVTEGTYSGTLASFQTGFRPQKIVQFEPVPKVSTSDVTLKWHIAPCYTSRTTGFTIEVAKEGGATTSDTVSTHEETTTYTATGLDVGGTYTFTVTPLMSEGEGEGRANSVTTTIGEPKAAPEFLSVSSVACGIELLQQDIFIECAYGSVNKIDLTCSESTTAVVPYSSHLTILPDNKLTVTKVGNVFTVNVDATAMDPKWSGEMLVLTLVAKNADGTEAYKNLMLRFNSMRQVINGTFDAADGDSNSAVWFCGDTTIDAKGRAVSFGASAFQGTGKVTLTDSVGTGSFTFASLDNFTGTLVFTGNCSVTLPEDMTGFSGILKLTSGTYNISSDFTSDATIILDGAANDYESVVVNLNSVNLGATVTGWGTIKISSGECTFAKTIASNSTLVRLTGGTLTTPADDSAYCHVQMIGGTLKVGLTEAQTQLGYKWKLPNYQSGDIKFVLSNTTEEDVTVVVEGGLATISHETDANIWTGTDYWYNTDRYSDTTKWSKGVLPGNGDYVIFNSAGNGDEGMNGYGTAMVLNLPSAVNLGYVQVRGDSGLEITTVSGISTAVLKVGVLENQVMTKIKATEFQPETVIPKRALYISEGYPLTCDLEYRYADNLKQSNSSSSALISSAYWQGTVLLSNQNVSNLEISNYGNAQSKIRFNGVTGSLMGGKTFDGTLELVDYDGAPAFNLNSGSSNYGVTIGAVAGSGMFKTSGSASTLNILLKDISDWTGSFDLASKTIAIGQAIPSSYTGNDGRLHICQEATVVDGATWKAAGGLYLGAGGALTINGAVEAKNVTTYGTGASITLEDGAVLQVSAASANDQTPTLNFKAGTFRVKEGSDAFRETATINFCAGSGKRTVIDANGATLTLGPNVFSGSGDVCLTSSKEGGKIIVEGVAATYTGTIYCDISCEVSLGDLSKASDCSIDVSDIIISRSSNDIGNFTIGAGASLEVTVSKAHLMSGLEIDSVTLVDGGTLVLRDKDGKELEYTTSDGKYIMEADSSVTAECLLDYEFNGNVASTGSDNNATLQASSTITYYDGSALYTKCTPWITKEFAMPDDEWTSVIRGTLPAANSEKPTIVIMFGANGGNIFGLVAGTEENTVALADRSGIIGSAVAVDDATTKYHVYTIVKTASRVRLYVDGVLKVDEARVVSVPKKFQIGSVHGSNNSSYASCTGDESRLDYLKFYDFAVGEDFDEMVYSGPKPVAVWDGDFSSSELTKFSGYELVDWNETHGENNRSVTIDRANQGLMFRSSTGLSGMTVLVRYSNLQAGTTNKRVLFTSTINSNYTGTRAGIRLASGSAGTLRGLSGNTDWDDSRNPESGSVNESGVMAFTYSNAGTYLYKGSSLDDLAEAWSCADLKWASDFNNSIVYGAGIGGYCEGASATGYEAAQGMTITAIAVFDSALTASVLQDYRWPSEASEEPEEPEPTFEVSPASGAVAYGTKMTVTCSDPDATIWHKNLMDADYTEYTEPVALATGINYYYVKVNDGEATLYTYIVSAPEPAYDGPEPIAVWVAGEFDDDRSAHGGLEFALNGNTTNSLGEIVIGTTTTLGAEVGIPAGHSIASVLVKYSIPDGAHVDNSVLASMFSAYDLGVLSDSGESTGKGYWYTGSAVSDGSYAFSNTAPSIPQEGYLLLSYKHDSSTAAYLGSTISTLVGGSNGSLHFSNNDVTKMAFGGPTVEGAKPWAGMVIKGVAIFLDEYLSNTDLANYTFPAQGAVQPVDSDRYVVEPVVSWVNDFKTTTKGDYTLSVSGTTAAKDDTFGGTLTIGDAAAIIDTTAANSTKMTVLIKYRAASSVVSAPVVAFGGMAAVGLDVGVYTKSDKTLAVYRNFSTDNTKPYDFGTAPQLSATGGYVLCARDNGQQCMAYVGDSLDAMTGGTVSDGGIKFSNITLTKLGIGGNSGMAASANDMVPFAGLEIEKVVVFDGYYTPDQIRYVENPEDGDTVNIASGATWKFAAGETRTYTNIGTLNGGGTIAITNAATLVEGTYKLAEWTTPQQYTTQGAGYGKVGTLVTDGLASGLSARLIYGARAIYLRVDDTAKQAARKPLVVWCYGDSITEGYNAQATGANYRILLYQKLEMLGYNVRSTGVYGLSNGNNSVDPSGTPLTDQYRWHSAKHGATAGPSSLSHRSNLSENVDTLAIQAGTPDVALLLIGVNDLPQFTTVEPVFAAWTNVVNRLVNNLPNTKIIVSTILYSDGTRTDIDPKITNINDNYIKPLMASLPEAWQGHVVLADLNSIVKSGQPGIIYSDHLHPDWWGYDQMADGYLDKIVECYPDPDATDFPSQNPIPDAPTADQLGAANKPELAAYREGFTRLCNIRVEKGQDVSNIEYDDVNDDAVSEDIGKVGYFVEFVRADNHAHKWVWVDMDAFGDADLASVGLPQRIYQQAVTRMHVCSNHGAIDNVAADDDSVTGWIEFSPYDYTRTGSNSAAPANYGDPFDWNDTLSESGSYGCMQVFRVMNPSSRELYQRPQLMFAFNNFQLANDKPADFGIGNFAQHFNCNNGYHTEDWTGVGGTLAKMAPDQYSVKTIEIWTKGKDTDYSGPAPIAVWVAGEFGDDRSAHGGLEFALNGNTIDENGNIVIGNSTTLGATVAVPSGTLPRMTMLVKYSVPAGGAPVAQSVPASLFSTYDLGALAGAGSSALAGYWLNGSTINTGSYAFSDPAQTMPQEGYILISNWTTTPNSGDHGTAVYSGETLSTLVGGEKTGLRFTGADKEIAAVGVGGPTVAGAKPWAGMVIKSVALFDEWVSTADVANYKFPEKDSTKVKDEDGNEFSIPYSWIEKYFPQIEGYPDEMYNNVAKSPADNGRSYWECYVLNLDPTKSDSKFIVTIRMNGQTPVIEYVPENPLVDEGVIRYVLQGKPELDGEWEDRDSIDKPGDNDHFFRIKVKWGE